MVSHVINADSALVSCGEFQNSKEPCQATVWKVYTRRKKIGSGGGS